MSAIVRANKRVAVKHPGAFISQELHGNGTTALFFEAMLPYLKRTICKLRFSGISRKYAPIYSCNLVGECIRHVKWS